MQTEQLTYAQLERLLLELGYREAPTEEDARVFANKSTMPSAFCRA